MIWPRTLPAWARTAWWKLTGAGQQPVQEAAPGEWWASMEQMCLMEWATAPPLAAGNHRAATPEAPGPDDPRMTRANQQET